MFGLASRRSTPLRWQLLSLPGAASAISSSSAIRFHQPPPCKVQRHTRAFHKSLFSRQQAAARRTRDDEAENTPPQFTKFEELSQNELVDDRIIKNLTHSRQITNMTEVQSRTLSESLAGRDILAQAKTGTGKTLAFLLPMVQNILKNSPEVITQTRGRLDKPKVQGLIISPTRELAEQIEEEAKKLVDRSRILVHKAVGGTQKRMHVQLMARTGAHILVATPGRLKDLLEDPYVDLDMSQLDTFVLDEADRLLDMGFSKDIEEIRQLLPSHQEKDRQTMLFSATMPRDIVQLARNFMKPNLHYMRATQETDIPTTELVKQMLVGVPSMAHLFPATLELCSREIQKAKESGSDQRPFKAIIYLKTVAETELFGNMLKSISRMSRKPVSPDSAKLGNVPVSVIHSRLTQQQRSAAADGFRQEPTGILVSSDVTARGMDFPNVTHVIQIGFPSDRDTYIHRIGRTARAGTAGEGWLIAHSNSLRHIKREIGDLPLNRDNTLDTARAAFEDSEESLPEPAMQYFTALRDVARHFPDRMLTDAYRSNLGSVGAKGVDPEDQIADLNQMTRVQWGMEQPPAVSPLLVSKLGLNGVPGLVFATPEQLRSQERENPRNRSFGRGRSANGSSRRDPFDIDFDGSNGRRGRSSERGGFGGRGFSRDGGYDQRGFGGQRGFSRDGGYDRRGFGGQRGLNRDGARDRGGYDLQD